MNALVVIGGVIPILKEAIPALEEQVAKGEISVETQKNVLAQIGAIHKGAEAGQFDGDWWKVDADPVPAPTTPSETPPQPS